MPWFVPMRRALIRLGLVQPHRIFIASTAEDLGAHRLAAERAIKKHGGKPDMHEDWDATGEPTVSGCLGNVASNDALVVIVGERYGWDTTVAEDGDRVVLSG